MSVFLSQTDSNRTHISLLYYHESFMCPPLRNLLGQLAFHLLLILEIGTDEFILTAYTRTSLARHDCKLTRMNSILCVLGFRNG
jgi:hypothetical protein